MFGAVSPRAFCRRTRLPTLWIARAFALVVDALTRAFVVAVEQARNRSPKREASAFSAAGLMRKAPNAPFDERQEKFVGHCRHHSGGRPLAVVTGASAGIGFELAQVCAVNNFDVAIASNKARIYDAAANLDARGANVVAIEADLSTIEGVDRLFMTQLSNSAGPLTSSSRTRALDWATPSSIKTFKKKCVMSSTPTSPNSLRDPKIANSIAGWPSRALRGASGSRHQC